MTLKPGHLYELETRMTPDFRDSVTADERLGQTVIPGNNLKAMRERDRRKRDPLFPVAVIGALILALVLQSLRVCS